MWPKQFTEQLPEIHWGRCAWPWTVGIKSTPSICRNIGSVNDRPCCVSILRRGRVVLRGSLRGGRICCRRCIFFGRRNCSIYWPRRWYHPVSTHSVVVGNANWHSVEAL